MKKAIITTIILSAGVLAASSVKSTLPKQTKFQNISISNSNSGKEIASAD